MGLGIRVRRIWRRSDDERRFEGVKAVVSLRLYLLYVHGAGGGGHGLKRHALERRMNGSLSQYGKDECIARDWDK